MSIFSLSGITLGQDWTSTCSNWGLDGSILYTHCGEWDATQQYTTLDLNICYLDLNGILAVSSNALSSCPSVEIWLRVQPNPKYVLYSLLLTQVPLLIPLTVPVAILTPRALIALLKLADLAGVLYCDCSLGSGGSYAATGIQTSKWVFCVCYICASSEC